LGNPKNCESVHAQIVVSHAPTILQLAHVHAPPFAPVQRIDSHPIPTDTLLSQRSFHWYSPLPHWMFANPAGPVKGINQQVENS
jgi:hypothetical protein